MEKRNQLITTVLSILLLLGFGTLGYMLIEDWAFIDALYMTVITLATVGYGEVHQVSMEGRLFTVVLIVIGVGYFLYLAGNAIQIIVEGQIRQVLGRRKLDKQISQLNNHYIVCGYGRVGRALCRFLKMEQLPFVVIEQDQARNTVLNDDGNIYVLGDATDETILTKCGIDRAKCLMSVLATDADNVFQVLTAKQLNPNLFIVARAIVNASKNKLYAAGAGKVISPYELGARRMAHAVIRPTVIHFLELAFVDEQTDIHVEEMQVKASSALVDVALQDSNIRKDLDIIIIAIRKPEGNMRFNPSADTKIRVGDTLVVVGTTSNLVKLEKMLNP